MRMEETYYRPMAEWCASHGLELMGHPERPDDLALQKYFSVPGQDLVWRWVLPGETATGGPQSTQGKCAASAAAHLGRARNSNEFCGAYGHELTFEEMKWLGDWCLVRGQNWLIPHAYYYSQRGPRHDERPPDVGLNAPWADRLKRINSYWEFMCRLIAEAKHVVSVAILGSGDELPWKAAEVLFQNQIDFNYLQDADLAGGAARISPAGIDITGYHYDVLIDEGIGDAGPAADVLRGAGRAVSATRPGWLAEVLNLTQRTLSISPACRSLRVRQMMDAGRDVWFIFNEGGEPIMFRTDGPSRMVRLDSEHEYSGSRQTGQAASTPLTGEITLGAFEALLANDVSSDRRVISQPAFPSCPSFRPWAVLRESTGHLRRSP